MLNQVLERATHTSTIHSTEMAAVKKSARILNFVDGHTMLHAARIIFVIICSTVQPLCIHKCCTSWLVHTCISRLSLNSVWGLTLTHHMKVSASPEAAVRCEGRGLEVVTPPSLVIISTLGRT